MIPLYDENPTIRTPVMTIALLAVIWGVWLFGQGGLAIHDPYAILASVCNYGMVPGEITGLAPIGSGIPIAPGMSCVIDDEPVNLLTPVLSIFLHGGWGHVIGNSIYLWVFGNNVEDSMGRGRFLAFFLLTGVAAAMAHVLVNPSSPVPTVGASGAISGVMGGYLILYPHCRVRTFIPPFFFFRFAAWVVLIFWFIGQLLTGLPSLIALHPEVSGGVAVWAHVGGFVAGVLLIRRFKDPELIIKRKIQGNSQVVWQ